MALRRVEIEREIHEGTGAHGCFLLTDVVDGLDRLLPGLEGKVKLIYLDPPFQTGDRFMMRVRVGADEWKRGRGSLVLPSYSDRLDHEAFMQLMREVLVRLHSLLREDGLIFLHIDYRTHPYLRLMMDEIFGEENFLNEIIWAYQTGGRSRRYFSRKHDVILFYSKSKKYDFNLEAVMAPPNEPPENHMRRHVDPDGRVYRSMRVGGRTYTYYDDDPVAPSDVWNDLSHLQQRDPERTGYDTQKPLSLLDRIVRCGSRPGDLVLDPFAGSSTTLEAARRLERDFIGIDRCALTLNIARRRLQGASFELRYPPPDGAPLCEASVSPGVGFYQIRLECFELEAGLLEREFEHLDGVEGWSVGYIHDGCYEVLSQSLRSRREPELRRVLEAPVYSGRLALCVYDVTGRSFCYEIVPE